MKINISQNIIDKLTAHDWDTHEIRNTLPHLFPDAKELIVEDCTYDYIIVNKDGKLWPITLDGEIAEDCIINEITHLFRKLGISYIKLEYDDGYIDVDYIELNDEPHTREGEI